MKQNKKVVAIFVIIVLIVANVSFSAFAYTDNSLNNKDFTEQPLPVYTSDYSYSFLKSNGYLIKTVSESNKYYAMSNQDDTYIFESTGDHRIYAINLIQFVIRYANDTNSVDILNGNDLANGYYRAWWNNGFTINPEVPSFSSYNDGINALQDWINNPPAPQLEPKSINYTIPAGYAFVVDISGLQPTGKLITSTSRAFASPHVSNQTIAYVNQIPSAGTSPLGNGISWNGVGNKDLFGRYKSWQHNLIPSPAYDYLVVYNPVHIDSYVDPEHEDYNSSITITLTEARSGKLIALNTELTSSGQVGTVSSDNEGNITFDEETNTWVTLNEDGTPYNPTPYGDYLPNTTNSVSDWLQNISNQISGFFTGAIGAVTTLVSAGSAFFQTLIGLYGWLPISVMSVLTSALIIVITIGVIKVFL